MKMYPILRRLLCCSLTVVMVVSSQGMAFAAEANGSAPSQEIISKTEISNKKQSNNNSEDISTNLESTKSNSEEVSSKRENSQKEEFKNEESVTEDSIEEESTDEPSEKEDSKEESQQKDVDDAGKVSDTNEVETDEKTETNADVSEDKTFNVKKGDFYITAFVPAGTFDVDVEFIAEEICLSTSEQELVNEAVDDAELESYCAFDLRFEADGEEIEPREGSCVKISIEAPEIETDAVVHIKDAETAETIESDITAEKVSFESDSFSVYVLATAGNRGNNSKKVLYDNDIYGFLRVNNEYSHTTSYKGDNFYKSGRVALKVFQQNNFFKDHKTGKYYAPVEIAPVDNDNFLIYGYKNNIQNFNFTFKAPENYYVAKLSLYEYRDEDFINQNPVSVVPINGYQTECTVPLTLRQMTKDDPYVANAVVVELEPKPAQFTSEKPQYVEHAKLINYVNGRQRNIPEDRYTPTNDIFGKYFRFGDGQQGLTCNRCRDGQVYQGLAVDDITNGVFRLTSDNGNEIFPDYANYTNNWWWREFVYKKYITEYYNEVGVRFDKDEDGYWTLDSSRYKYYYDANSNKVEIKNGTEFRPFIMSDSDIKKLHKEEKVEEAGDKYLDNHFAMTLPISFAVTEDGKTVASNGDVKDTVFKFFGDDDVFVYVDGKLVLDLGGVHNAVLGQINFRTGEILIQGNLRNQLTSSRNDTCYVNDNGRMAKKLGVKNLYTTSEHEGIFSYANVREFSQKNHVLTVVYFERGANESNCKISYNFNKTETRTVDFKGFKVDENQKGLANAQFTLYSDESCTEDKIAVMGIGVPAVTYSQEDGTIEFNDLSAGAIETGKQSVTKTYYLKETQAPEGYDLPENAIWKLELTANADGSKSQKLIAFNEEAKALSLGDLSDVKAVKNYPEKYAKTLTVNKKVTYGSDEQQDIDAQYVFVIAEAVDGNYRLMTNQSFHIGDKESKTNEYGQFVLKADESAVFDGLMENRYKITETFVLSGKGYKLDNYDTKVIVDGDEANAKIFKHDDNLEENPRFKVIDFDKETEKVVEFENSLVKMFDWKLTKVSTSGKTLKGAEFTLASEAKVFADKYYGLSNEEGEVLWYSSVENRKESKNPVEIPVGTYTLSETSAPGGYAKSEDVWHVTIDKENGVSAYITKEGDLAGKTVVDEKKLNNGAVLKTTKFTFENEVAYTLPATGGRGFYPYTISGVLLMMLATLLLYKKNNVYEGEIEMKNFKKVIASALIAVMMMAMSVTAFAAEETATIKVTNISSRDDETVVSVYTLATIDSANNEIKIKDWAKSAYNAELTPEFNATELNKAFAAAREKNDDDAKPVKEAISYNGADLEFNGLAGGVYMIKAVGKKVQYNTMVAVVYKTTEAGKYVTETEVVTIKAKGSENTVDKVENDSLAHAGQDVHFTLTSTVPYMKDLDNTMYKVYDKATNLSAPKNVKVLLNNVERKDKEYSFDSGVAKDGSVLYTMDLSKLVAADEKNENAGKTITIEYDATVLGVNGYVNQAYDSTYDLDEFGDPKKTPPEVYGYSADIELTKYNSDKSERLGGAKFVITHKNNTLQFVYNTVDKAYELFQKNMEYTADKYLFNEGKVVVSSTVETSSEKDTLGKLTVKGLEEGEYIFEETEAPDGYAINRDQLRVTIKDQSGDLKTVKYENMTEQQKSELHKTTEFLNSKLAKLPFTGGMGTTIFTVLGVAMMVAASALYFATKKKASVN